MIEFPQDAREFRGGFATVSQGLLASPSPAEGDVNKSGQVADQRPSSETGNPQCDNHTQNPRGEHPGKEEEADGNLGDTEEKGRKDDGQEGLTTHDQTSMTKIVDQSDSPEHMANEGPELADSHSNPQSDTHGDDSNREGKDEGTKSGVAGGTIDQTKDEGRKQSENTNQEQNSGLQNPKPKVGDVLSLSTISVNR